MSAVTQAELTDEQLETAIRLGRHFARRMPWLDVEEVLQEARISAWLAVAEFDPRRGEFEPYLYGWMKNRLDKYSKRELRQTRFAGQLVEEIPCPVSRGDRQSSRREASEILLTLIHELGSPDRHVMLCTLRGWPITSIARQVHRHPGVVGFFKRRAIASMRVNAERRGLTLDVVCWE